MQSNERLAEFLGLVVPENLLPQELSVVEMMDNERVKQILSERDPQLFVSRCAYLTSKDSNIVLGSVKVTAKHCEGHFPWFPIMPLALVGQASAQVGAILVSLVENNQSEKIPLVVQVKNIRSISEKGGKPRKDFIIPGDTMLVMASYSGGKFGFHRTNITIYVGEHHMASLDEVSFVLIDKEYFAKKQQ